jgi:uncharacterized lipoprotein
MCVKKLSFVVAALLSLSACSSKYSSNGEQVYLKSKNGPQLTVPAPLTSANISHFYDLPLQNQDARVGVAPPG